MTFGETVKAAREAKGWNKAELGRAINSAASCICKIEAGDGTTYEMAAAICEVLGIKYPLDNFKHRTRHKMDVQSWRLQMNNKKEDKRKDTTAADEAAARKRGLSYGVYMSYKESGYLKTYDEQRAALLSRDEDSNIIQSHIGAGVAGSRRPQSVDGAKLS